MIIIIDYGLGNLASVLNMVDRVGGKAKTSNKVSEILMASRLILPGIGSFDHGVAQLHSFGLFVPIQELASKGVPILGICLGMQLLSNRSEEGRLKGLALIDAHFKRFSFENTTSLNIPHVGWNRANVVKNNSLIPNDGTEQRFYFTHSYHAVCSEETDVLAITDYGYPFPSVYCRGNVFGVQFHPEKSHRFGMALIKRFLQI